jgi:small subunit ribosomal protein S2
MPVKNKITIEKEKPKTEKIVDKKAKLAAVLEKAKLLEKGIEEKPIHVDKDGKEEEKADTLVSIEDYLKSSVHLGTRVITPDMKKFVYKRRADGLAVFNTTSLDEKIREASEFLAKYAPEDIVLVCKREAGWKAVELFSKVTGVRIFTKKYPAGILTNPNLENFTEAEIVFICDPWIDKNTMEDARKIKIPVLSICDTNNYTHGVTQVLPGNNKSAKSLGMILYLLTKLYSEKRKMKIKVPEISEFIENWENLVPPK